MTIKTLNILLCVITLTLVSPVMAQNIPQLINYQGFMTDQNGKSLTGEYNIIFRLYPDTGKTTNWDWREEQTVNIANGLYNVLLGSINPLTPDILQGDTFLGIIVAGEVEMEPRLRFASVPYSYHADQLDNEDAEDFVHVSGDTMTGPLIISGTATDVTTPDNEHLNLNPGGTGKVGIGTDNPQAKLDVAGEIFVNGGAPFYFKRYTHGSYTELREVKTVELDTGMKKNEWHAAIVGYDLGFGDLSESGNVRLWKIQMIVKNNNWIISLDSPTHSAGYPDWTIDVMFVKNELVSSSY